MKSSGKNIELASFDSIFSTEETRQGGNQRIEQLPLSDLVPFKDHPFRVVDDDRMKETVESIREYGVLVPIIVRPMDDGTYDVPCIALEPIMVTEDNIDEVIIASGFHLKEDVYLNVPGKSD